MASGDVILEVGHSNISYKTTSTNYYGGSVFINESLQISDSSTPTDVVSLSIGNSYDTSTGSSILGGFDPEKTYKITVEEV